MSNLFVRQVRPWGEAVQDIRITDRLISEIGTDLPAAAGETVIEGDGAIAIPGLIDAHTHMDKTRLGLPWRPHTAGPTIREKIDNERRIMAAEDHDPEVQSTKQVRLAISKGSTGIRTHVDVAPDLGLRHIEGVLATRAAFADSLDIEIVAFPQQGVVSSPGTAELMDAAIKAGADQVGGIDPSLIERDPVGHLDTIFGLAERNRVGIDIHLHEPGDLGGFAIELIAERTKALAMAGKVVISHAFCLGMVAEPYLGRLLDLLRENDIAIMTHAPGASPFPPILRLREHGVRVCSGSDGIRDAWGPYGNADMLERAMLLGFRSNYRRDEELEEMLRICTEGGAQVMGLKDYGLRVGAAADLVLIDGTCLSEAIVSRPARRAVIAKGRLVAENGNCLI